MTEKIINESRIEGDLIFDGKIIFVNDCYVTGNVKAGRGIEAREWIEAGEAIWAGGGIEAEWVFSFTFSVSAKTITTKFLPFWRNYWAEMPPLKKWREDIMNDEKCWGDYPKMLTKKEKEEICAWDGWHWILRAQLEMYLGLKKEHVIQ